MLELHLVDDAYPFVKTTHVREIARAVLLDAQGRVCLTKLFGDDIFGHRDYYETPGGGIEPGETPEQAVVRELAEETGLVCTVIEKIGDVNDFYNLIGRENHNHYFLCLAGEYIGEHRDEGELRMLQKLVWATPEGAVALFEKMDDRMLSGLVKRRELPVLKAALPLISAFLEKPLHHPAK